MAKTVLLTGVSGAGKSSSAKEFFKLRGEEEWAYINQDNIRLLLKSGRQSADGTYSEWNNATRRQWKASIDVCVSMAKSFNLNNINCLIDCYTSRSEFPLWQNSLASLDHITIVLMPSKDSVFKRNVSRNQRSRLSQEKMEEVWKEFSAWKNAKEVFFIDNSEGSAINCAKDINKLID